MEELKKRKTRMYDPWGYQEENDYQSVSIITENELDSFFVGVSYDSGDTKIHFSNKDGEEVATLDTSGFTNGVVDHVEYADGILTITFTNGQTIEVDLTQLIDENEFKDGLTIDDHVVKVKIDEESEGFLSVSENGVKVDGVNDAINTAVDAEKTRAEGAESALQTAIDAETTRAEGAESALQTAIDAETTRAEGAESALQTAINAEETRARNAEVLLDQRIDSLNDAITNEKLAREAKDTALENKIDAEIARATNAEAVLDDKIEALPTPQEMEKIIDYLGYKDNDTLETKNENEAAFGQYNLSKNGIEASGQTVFTIGNGTSDSNRSNALEVMKNGDVYILIENEMLCINKLLSQLAHEVYDSNTNP